MVREKKRKLEDSMIIWSKIKEGVQRLIISKRYIYKKRESIAFLCLRLANIDLIFTKSSFLALYFNNLNFCHLI